MNFRSKFSSLSTKGRKLGNRLLNGGNLVLLGALLLGSIGCNSKSGLHPVTGMITIDGKPVTTGRIEFFPQSGRPAAGDIGNFGRYQLTTYSEHDGVLEGSYVVTITAMRTKDVEPQFKSFEEEMAYSAKVESGEVQPDMRRLRRRQSNVEWIVPAQFSNRTTSGLTAEVTKDGKEINFELESNL